MCVTSERMMAQNQSCIHISVRSRLLKHWQNLTMLLVEGRSCCTISAYTDSLPAAAARSRRRLDRLAGALGAHDDPRREIVRPDAQAGRYPELLEGDEVLDNLLDVGTGSIGIAERRACGMALTGLG